MNDYCVIGVPVGDKADLDELASELNLSNEFADHRHFDGQTFLELIVPLSTVALSGTATWATLRTWIKSRAEVQKTMRVTKAGIEITGYRRRDAERMIRLLEDRNGDASAETDEAEGTDGPEHGWT